MLYFAQIKIHSYHKCTFITLFCDSLYILQKELYTLKTQKNKKLLDVVREKLRIKHYSIKTEKTYLCQIEQKGVDIRTIQELLGHKDISTTMIYVHIVIQFQF